MHKFDPAKLHRLISPERDTWLRPQKVLEELTLGPMLKVVDLGSGPGYFALPIAERVGASGSVFALDVEPAMLDTLTQRATAAGLSNILAILTGARNIPIKDEVIDRVLISLVLHEVPEKSRLLSEIGRILKAQGQVVIVEWQPWRTEHGPDPGERLAPEAIAGDLSKNGLDSFVQSPLGADCYILTAHKTA